MSEWVEKDEGAPSLHESLTIEDLDRAYSKLVGRGWDSWPPLFQRDHRHFDYYPLNMWDEIE